MPSGRSNHQRVAIVGASSLRGKELRQVLEDRHFPATDFVLLDESVVAGTLTEAAGEPTFIRALDQESFEGGRFAFFAGTTRDAEQNWNVAQRSGAIVIDLTGALGAPGHASAASARIPSLASVLPTRVNAKGNGTSSVAPLPAAYESPSAPVIIACTLAAGLGKFQPQRISVLLFPPVSEREEAGVEELEKQTTGLLSFQKIAKPVFDAQVAFNLLASYGPEAKPSLADMRASIARDVAAYLHGRALVPAIQLVQAPVFYGYAFAAYAEFPSSVGAEQLHAAFANLGVKVAAPDDAPPSNVSVAGEAEIHLARIESDPNIAGGVWVWGVADNLRLSATNAVRIAEELLAKSSE
jgi:aspartate-semialdehyde dehydrogenase